MDDISNRTLALFLVTGIVVSLGATVYTLNTLQSSRLPTGMAQSGTGEVNLTVESTLSIVMRGLTRMDFGSGYVNTSCALASYANLSVTNTGYTDQSDCWTSQVAAPNQPTQPFRIENDGNQNVTLSITCPHPNSFFSGYAGTNLRNLSWKARNNETNTCTSSGSLVGSWTMCTGSAQTICAATSMKYTPESTDEIAVDINLVIPDGLSFQQYKNDTITFRAT